MPSIDFPNSPAVNDVFTAGNSSYRWTGTAWVSNNLSAITWESLSGKPATFPPSTHTHVIADTTGLQAALDGKAATSHTHVKANITDFAHTHPISEVTNLQTSLDGKAATVHTHAIADVTGLQTALDGKAATSHTHSIADVTGLQTALDSEVNRVNGTVTTASTSLAVVRNITLSTSAPSGGMDGDVWLVYEA